MRGRLAASAIRSLPSPDNDTADAVFRAITEECNEPSIKNRRPNSPKLVAIAIEKLLSTRKPGQRAVVVLSDSGLTIKIGKD